MTAIPPEVIEAYGLEDATFHPITVGHINRTFRAVRPSETRILQELNSVFDPAVHENIDAVTCHLRNKGVVSPLLICNKQGGLFVQVRGGNTWRLQTFVAGQTFERCLNTAMAAAAGLLAGRFHRALVDLRYDFVAQRPNVHNLERHCKQLELSLQRHSNHRHLADIEPVAKEILSLGTDVGPLPQLPMRAVHGDMKISNALFEHGNDGQVHGVCFVDLDTVGRMPIVLEVGDALRSWCHKADENDVQTVFDLEFYRAALSTYLPTVVPHLALSELQVIPQAIARISLGLACRFCADALNETYFAWDNTRFLSASEHNLHRARSQLGVHRSLRQQQQEAQDILDDLLMT